MSATDGMRTVICDSAPEGRTTMLVAFLDSPCVYCGEIAADHDESL